MKRFTLFLLLLVLAFTLPAQVQGEGAPPGLTGGSLAKSNAAFTGENSGDNAGVRVADVGDVNGDGYADLLIGAYGYNSNTGRVYLFLGGPSGWQLDQGVAGADAIYTGEGSNNYAGTSIAGAGDVNGDGYADMLIGASGYDNNTGQVYLVLGSASPSSINLSGADAVYTGEASSNFAGDSVAGAGDVNGDGYADLLIGAYGNSSGTGRAYLVLGKADPGSINLADADAVYTGETSSNAGDSVAGAGDVNGDGYADLLIGASTYNGSVGRAYLVLGSASPSSMPLSAANAIYTGEGTGDYAGDSVAGAGDVNGDGYADLLVGASSYSSETGCVYLVLGSASPSTMILSAADAIYIGATNSLAGYSLKGAGDVNADGYADLLIGAPGTGRVYLVLGSASPGSLALSAANVIYTGEDSGSGAGISVAGVGDVNGDSYADLLVGANAYSSDTGRAYLIFSDYGAANGGGGGARYRAMLPAGNIAPLVVGDSGVTVDYGSGSKGSVYVTRHYRNTCNTEIATNGLLWRVDSERGSSAEATLTFTYNNTQIAGLTEANLKLWHRARPCQEWTEDSGATLDATHNRITSNAVIDVHSEYTIAENRPSPTALRITDTSVMLAGESPWAVVGLAVLAILAAGAHWWQRRQYVSF